MTFLDKTFCGSPKCENKCGRKMTVMERARLNGINKINDSKTPVSYAYFCGWPDCEHDYKKTLAISGMWFDEVCTKCRYKKSALEKLGLTNED